MTQTFAQGLTRTDHIGLVGAAVSDLPGIASLCRRFSGPETTLSFSSLRADALSPELLDALRRSRVKTATIAPEAGSERLRRVINKGLCEQDVLNAATALVAQGIPAEARDDEGGFTLCFEGDEPVELLLERAGRMPLPPYIAASARRTSATRRIIRRCSRKRMARSPRPPLRCISRPALWRRWNRRA